ncbi:MAG: hypothetical protein CVV13_12540 [Gammaproteobacteria bacterium HGW-Gammaproteobacteria-3]|jgi:hypothetical protein|nr:MAG: hypothetical protein CVV13_12540 [Gammaproteobacteria bacterium HGW-Gammaproteobacteria-3]
MKNIQLCFGLILPLLMAGCAGVTDRQAEAPVYDPYKTAPAARKKPASEKSTPSHAVETSPLKPSAPPTWARPVEPSQTEHLSPVVVALISDAERNSGTGNLDSAVATLERGLRIEPRNATLMYKLAEVRLKQSQPRLAEDLARKAALLAGRDTKLKRDSWLLIARARKMQGDDTGERQAKQKAYGL